MARGLGGPRFTRFTGINLVVTIALSAIIVLNVTIVLIGHTISLDATVLNRQGRSYFFMTETFQG